MTDLNRALLEIQTIRRQVAHSTEFRGYGSATLLATAVLAVVAGVLQAQYVANPAQQRAEYAGLWVGTAIVCASLCATQMLKRADRVHVHLANAMVSAMLADFLPAAAAGAVLPFVLLRLPLGVFWMLPALWQIIFSLGVFASCRSLPRPMLLVGSWFLAAGYATLWLGDARALAPYVMAGSFAVGIAGIAAIQRYVLTRSVVDDYERV